MNKIKHKRLPWLSEALKVDACHKLMVYHFERSMDESMLSKSYKGRFGSEGTFKGKNRQDDFLMARKYACWVHLTFFFDLWKKYDSSMNSGLLDFYSRGVYKPYDEVQIVEDFKKFCQFLKQNFDFYQGKEMEGPEKANFSCFDQENYPSTINKRITSTIAVKKEDLAAYELIAKLD